MADEAICYEMPTKFARYTIGNVGSAIAKGELLRLITPNSVDRTAVEAGSLTFAGIAFSEHLAADTTETEVNAALNGVWGLSIVGSCIIGQGVRFTGSEVNTVTTGVTLDNEQGYFIGRALETKTGDNVYVKVRLGE